MACYRVTHLFVEDDGPFDILKRFRFWLLRNAHRHVIIDTVAKAFDCKYCMGLWAAFLVYFLPTILVFILAVAGTHYLIESIMDKE